MIRYKKLDLFSSKFSQLLNLWREFRIIGNQKLCTRMKRSIANVWVLPNAIVASFLFYPCLRNNTCRWSISYYPTGAKSSTILLCLLFCKFSGHSAREHSYNRCSSVCVRLCIWVINLPAPASSCCIVLITASVIWCSSLQLQDYDAEVIENRYSFPPNHRLLVGLMAFRSTAGLRSLVYQWSSFSLLVCLCFYCDVTLAFSYVQCPLPCLLGPFFAFIENDRQTHWHEL